ncbi:hypothetical protein FACS1894139_09730 [Planctomycetales bacterium]|nr:hypothetical protein FACS1894107_00810 [Planctomycetales bacterium]GHT00176.1 hypothetical protein FACS1894108_11660 [Planctomycetales bacterium]GHT05603.1 hypothetical protein FACS1894139_09730 [Planctomycetales bacterium]
MSTVADSMPSPVPQLPFPIIEDETGLPPPAGDIFYHPANIAWLTESMRQSERGEFVVKTMEELEEMMRG